LGEQNKHMNTGSKSAVNGHARKLTQCSNKGHGPPTAR
jgi:hypothetical protein